MKLQIGIFISVQQAISLADSLVVKIACAIGGLNATIIAGSKGEHPEREMQHFWLQLPAKPCSSDKQSIQNRSMFNQ